MLPLAKLLPKKAEVLQAQKLQVTVPLDAELKDKGNSFALRKVNFWFHTAPTKQANQTQVPWPQTLSESRTITARKERPKMITAACPSYLWGNREDLKHQCWGATANVQLRATQSEATQCQSTPRRIHIHSFTHSHQFTLIYTLPLIRTLRYIHTFIHSYIFTLIHTFTVFHTCTNSHTRWCSYIHAHIRSCIHTHTHAFTLHTLKHSFRLTLIHTHTFIFTHTHLHSLWLTHAPPDAPCRKAGRTWA